MIKFIGMIIVVFRQQNKDPNLRQKLINFFALHKGMCTNKKCCPCEKVFMILINNNEENYEECRIAFFMFLIEIIRQHQMKHTKNQNIQLVRMFIELIELGRVNPVAFQMKFINGQKFNLDALFNLFILELVKKK